jgi:hypothetical protein
MINKKQVLTGMIILSFILMTASVIVYLNNARNYRTLDPLDLEAMTKEQIIQMVYERQTDNHIPNFYFVPIFGFFGLVVGLVVFYLLSSDLEKKDQIIRHDSKILLNLLGPDERKVMRKVLDSNGKLQQVEITYMEGFTKVKAHRIVQTLVEKGILEKEQLGKARLIRMNKDIYAILKNN